MMITPLIKGHDRDGYQNFLISKVSDGIGNYFLQYVSASFHNLLGKDLSQVDVAPSDNPAYLTTRGNRISSSGQGTTAAHSR
jgi:hypothetical protein